jgi:transcription termination/antitermination protein NusG
VSHVPMFPGYLFLHHLMDKTSYTEVRKSAGLVSILGGTWDRLATLPDSEIAGIQQVVRASLPVIPYPYLREGDRIRIARGPLAGVEGMFIRANPSKGLLVVSISMLQRSIAVEVDCTLVSAA